MKPTYLEFCGVNSFSERAVVHFDRLLKGGIFGIFGDTGAGKSTVLDCIGFALYGKFNRIGRDGSVLTDAINYASSKAEVAFEFEAEWNGERSLYRIERSLSKTRGVQKAILYQKQEERFIALCETPSLVNKKIEEEIIGIGFDDFKKCIALPQGEFSKFLHAQRKERLNLIAKLFSLEEYGHALYKKVADRIDKKNVECEGIKGQLKGFEGITAEALTALENQEQTLSIQLDALQQKAQTSQAELASYEEKAKNTLALQEVRTKLNAVLALQPQMEQNRNALNGLFAAKQIHASIQECQAVQEKLQQTRDCESKLCRQESELTLAVEQQKMRICSLDTDAQIEELQRYHARVESASAQMLDLEQTENLLNQAREKYRNQSTELKQYAHFDYQAEKSRLTSQLEGLPQEESLLDYINQHFKSALLFEEYYVFSQELEGLAQKHPVILPDAQPLIDKYTARGVKESSDIYAQAEYFRKCAQKKAEIQKQLAELEIKNTKHAVALEKKSQLLAEGERLQSEYIRKKEALSQITSLGSLQSLQDKIQKLKTQKQQHTDRLEQLQQQLNALQRSLSAKQAEQRAYTQSIEGYEKQISQQLSSAKIPSKQAAQALLQQYGDPAVLQEKTEKYFLERHALLSEESRLAALTDGEIDREHLAKLRENSRTLSEEVARQNRTLAVVRSDHARMQSQLKQKTDLEKQAAAQLHDLGVLEQLKELVKADKFMEFVAVEYLQDMATNANNLLLKLTGGRYFLIYDKNFEVGDNFNGGALRGVHTLSGGETFLASLALALSLSAAIHQKSLRSIEFFFLDEGFGSLDGELVDTVMDSLEKLKNQNFSIGIISHVGELKQRLENKITVIKANGERGSRIE